MPDQIFLVVALLVSFLQELCDEWAGCGIDSVVLPARLQADSRTVLTSVENLDEPEYKGFRKQIWSLDAYTVFLLMKVIWHCLKTHYDRFSLSSKNVVAQQKFHAQ